MLDVRSHLIKKLLKMRQDRDIKMSFKIKKLLFIF